MDSNLQKYQALLKTVEYGSFTKAAEALGYTQSSVSKMIADLEQEWHINLLERSRGGVQITAEGMELLPYAQSLINDYRLLQEHVADLNGLQQGLIRIGVFSSVATHWMPKIIRAFQNDYPGIQYELLLGDYSEIENWIADGRVECGLGMGILPRMILQRIPYEVEIRPFTVPFYREIGLAFPGRKNVSTAVKRFIEYLNYRNS